MNAQRRKAIEEIINRLNELQFDLQCLKDEEEGAFDNLPENLQYSEKGEQMQECVDLFCDTDGYFSDLIGSVEELLNF